MLRASETAGPVEPAGRRGEGRGEIAATLAFWEKGRVVFNLAILATGTVLLVFRFEPPPSIWLYLRFLAIMLVLTNLVYCAAYPIDLAFRLSRWASGWLAYGRFAVWMAGTGLALAGVFALIHTS